MTVNVGGLISIVIFYLLILAVGLLAQGEGKEYSIRLFLMDRGELNELYQ